MTLRRRDFLEHGAAALALGPITRGLYAAVAAPEWPSVTRLLEGYVTTQRYAGVAAATSFLPDAPSFLNSGSLAFGSPEPITPDSIFRLYSVTKVFTAVLTLTLVEDGVLRLDQPVADVVPEFGRMTVAINPKNGLEPRPVTQVMTIEHLLTHRSGLSNWQPFLGDNPISAAYRARGLTPGAYGIHKQREGYGPQVQGLDALIGGLSQIPLLAEPGAEWNYAIGYDVLAAVIERTTGRPFAQVMLDRILAPLDMQSTGFQVPASEASRLTVMYGRTGEDTYVVDDAISSDFLRPPTLVAGGGGLVSTARDMTRFAGALLLNGQFRDVRIARPETIDQAIRLFSAPRGDLKPPLSDQAVLSAVGASSTLLHIDRARGLVVIFLAQLNRAGSPEEATRYRPELLAAIDADHRETH